MGGMPSIPVTCSAGDYMPDATPWIGYVASITRNDVDMKLGDRLTCGYAIVKANIKAVWFGLKRRLQVRYTPSYPFHQSALFGRG